MAVHGTINEVKTNEGYVTIYPLREKTDELTLSKLHPEYPFRFTSIFGPIPNLDIAIKYIKYELSPDYLVTHKMPKKTKMRKSKQKWLLLELVAIDRLLAEKKLVNWIVEEDPADGKKFRIIREVKRGVLTVEVREKDIGVPLALRVAYNEVRKGFLERLGDRKVLDLSKEEYKKISKEIKAAQFDKLAEISRQPLFAPIDESVTNEMLRKYYVEGGE